MTQKQMDESNSSDLVLEFSAGKKVTGERALVAVADLDAQSLRLEMRQGFQEVRKQVVQDVMTALRGYQHAINQEDGLYARKPQEPEALRERDALPQLPAGASGQGVGAYIQELASIASRLNEHERMHALQLEQQAKQAADFQKCVTKSLESLHKYVRDHLAAVRCEVEVAVPLPEKASPSPTFSVKEPVTPQPPKSPQNGHAMPPAEDKLNDELLEALYRTPSQRCQKDKQKQEEKKAAKKQNTGNGQNLQRADSRSVLGYMMKKETGKEQGCQRSFFHLLHWFTSLQEPTRSNCLAAAISTPRFDSMCSLVIVAHCLFTAYLADHNIKTLSEEPAAWVLAVEHVFLAFYAAELAARLLVHRLYFFVNDDYRWNMFDLLLVVLGYYDMIMTMSTGANAGGTTNVTFMRVVRILKLVKIFRMFRVMRFFRELRLMLRAIAGSMLSFFWCMLMLFMMLFIFALIFVQGVTTYLLENKNSPDIQDSEAYQLLLDSYGSMPTAVLTLYKATTGGADWETFFHVLEPVGWHYAGLFLFYTAFFTIAVFNVLTGIFVDHAMKVSEPERDDLLTDLRKQHTEEVEDVKDLCRKIDLDNSGTISWTEFETCAEDEVMKTYMSLLGLDVKDAAMFFDSLAEAGGSDEVDIDSFVEGCLRMKGPASGIDLQCLSLQVKVLQRSQLELTRHLVARLDTFQESVLANSRKLVLL
eukprot:gnl/TRDRNA2_/TRDRNA2_90070_c0_seq1.p1 gnl/TRDRNA2_/TRDRNA2_90070_c0~~gnl/TRDRNA2_/TRDRNA2_90070_c0_seq1.p1  ORF type:complete len:730 (+),score=165.39 gnl/TRDRNA2_/TRDRNA2_90070_c0_seq1:82-2190(+)